MQKIELLNLFPALVAVYFILKLRDINKVFIVVGLYFSLHYTYLYLPVILNEYSIYDIHEMRVNGSDIISKLLQVLIIGIAIIRIGYLIEWSPNYASKKYLIIQLMLFIGLVQNGYINASISLENIQYYLTMMLYIFVLYIAIEKKAEESTSSSSILVLKIVHASIIILILSIFANIYEVLINKSWVQTQLGKDYYIYRGSSFFYNPNLYAYFSALTFLGVLNLSKYNNRINLLKHILAILAIVAIFLSGSRSIYLILLFSVTLLVVFSNKIKIIYLYPILIYVMSCLNIYIFSDTIFSKFNNRINIFENIYLLSSRFYSIPGDLILYCHSKLIPYTTMFKSHNYDLVNKTIQFQTNQSIDGRLCWGCDNGWIVLLKDFGFIGLGAFLILYIILFKKIITSKQIAENKSTIAASLIFIIFAGSVLRFQMLTFTVVTSCFIVLMLTNLNRLHD